MSVWQRIGDFLSKLPQRTAGTLVHALDPDNWLPGGKDAAFTLALIALSAKMAVADGAVTASEVRAFYRTVVVPQNIESQVDRVFDMARRDIAGYETYARKIRKLFADAPETLEHVLDSLFYIASADSMIHEAELHYLKSVSDIFGFDEAHFEQLVAQHVMPDDGADPYIVLGLAPTADLAEVKRVYRSLVAEHHPDRLIAKGVPEELITIATARMAAINRAYALITGRRVQIGA